MTDKAYIEGLKKAVYRNHLKSAGWSDEDIDERRTD